MFGAVAASAAFAGIGLSQWRTRQQEAASPHGLWNMQFARLDDTSLSMQAFAGKPLLLNFWATWCPPCVEELPLLDRFHAAKSGNAWQVLGLAVDKPDAVKSFLQKVPVRFAVAMAGANGIELAKSLGNSGGGLPFTAVFDRAGNLLHRKMGRVTEQDLTRWSA